MPEVSAPTSISSISTDTMGIYVDNTFVFGIYFVLGSNHLPGYIIETATPKDLFIKASDVDTVTYKDGSILSMEDSK